MKVVRLYAYLQDNVGDDLMVGILLKRYPDVLFFFDYPESPSHGIRFESYRNFLNLSAFYRRWERINHFLNLITFNKRKDFFYRKALKYLRSKVRCSVYIGGSLYQQHTGITVQQEEIKLEDGPLFIIGANFGPYHDETFLKDFHEYFSRCGHVCFRDKKSYGLFSDLGNVSVAPDVVFNMNPVLPSTRGNKVLISVIDVRQRKNLQFYADQYINFISRACCSAVNQGLIPILVSFCKPEGDEEMVDEIRHSLPMQVREKTEIYLYGEDGKLLSLFAESCFVIATRFHAMILALIYHVPFFCISYNEKINNVLEDLDIHSWACLNDLSKVNVDRLWDSNSIVPDISQYQAKACNQFNALDRFLKAPNAI